MKGKLGGRFGGNYPPLLQALPKISDDPTIGAGLVQGHCGLASSGPGWSLRFAAAGVQLRPAGCSFSVYTGSRGPGLNNDRPF